MRHLGPDAGLEFLDLVDQGIDRGFLVQRPAFAWAHGNVPLQAVLCIRSLGGALLAAIAPGFGFVGVQRAVGFEHVVDAARGAAHGVRQARVRIHSNGGFHD